MSYLIILIVFITG